MRTTPDTPCEVLRAGAPSDVRCLSPIHAENETQEIALNTAGRYVRRAYESGLDPAQSEAQRDARLNTFLDWLEFERSIPDEALARVTSEVIRRAGILRNLQPITPQATKEVQRVAKEFAEKIVVQLSKQAALAF
jgi:hypothetical protein